MRKPLSKTERPMPVGVVSNNYSLVNHLVIAKICRDGLERAKITVDDLRYEVGLSELGEWMNLRIYLPHVYAFREADGKELLLRLECFNSVDGTTRLVILFGWFRFVCSNGLVIGETKIDIKERHGQTLDLKEISQRLWPAFQAVEADRKRMEDWNSEKIAVSDFAKWADGPVTDLWGKKAAARVFHICGTGRDVEFDDPFAPWAASEKPVRPRDRVPGSPDCAATKYDVAQALSYVASRRNNAEERVAHQLDIPKLLQRLTG